MVGYILCIVLAYIILWSWVFMQWIFVSKYCISASRYLHILSINVANTCNGLWKACVLYILRVGITDQMTEPTQRSFLVFLGQQVGGCGLYHYDGCFYLYMLSLISQNFVNHCFLFLFLFFLNVDGITNSCLYWYFCSFNLQI